jgi:class 3 adenylate cyclase
VNCPSCGAQNPEGKKFCSECGSPLALACPSCGAPLAGTEKFCGECGAALQSQTASAASPPAAGPTAERRLVSVLFADLVGFTTLSESRDAEEVRELLSRYFDTCKRLISLYGGTVEKFIGDAVMAVWGTPVAQEDDAERAVRAALDLVAAVSALGDEVGAPELRARAGVLTGEAAVTLGAEGQGMVAGDLVNTASRIQSSAEPGSVLVGESTKRASEAAIAYEDAGSQELKGKAEPVPLFQALRVIAGRRGEGRAAGLEAPFVGREPEFRLIRDLYHATASEQKARLVSIIGVAGIGKSRLGWEFYKYFDGLVEQIWWHRGRCLAYGEGVAYWALAEMVRMRAGIAEDEEPEAAAAKLSAALEEYVLDADERAWIEPRLQHLLGLAERSAPDREDLFSAWRLLFERLAEQGPAVFLFEDLQWADNALLDFIEYLLEWSRAYPIYVVALARPELMERRPTWGAGTRNARADRSSSRRSRARRAPIARERFRPREDLSEASSIRGLGGRRGGARAAAGVPFAQGGSDTPERSALARARSVRLPAGTRAEGRLRHACEGATQGSAPEGGCLFGVGPRTGRGRDRRGDRIPLPGGLPRRA